MAGPITILTGEAKGSQPNRRRTRSVPKMATGSTGQRWRTTM